MVTEVNCVGDADGLCFGVNDTMAAAVLEGDASVETVRAAEFPGAAGGWFVVDNDRIVKWQERGGIVVEGAIEVCPGWHAWHYRGLAEKVEC